MIKFHILLDSIWPDRKVSVCVYSRNSSVGLVFNNINICHTWVCHGKLNRFRSVLINSTQTLTFVLIQFHRLIILMTWLFYPIRLSKNNNALEKDFNLLNSFSLLKLDCEKIDSVPKISLKTSWYAPAMYPIILKPSSITSAYILIASLLYVETASLCVRSVCYAMKPWLLHLTLNAVWTNRAECQICSYVFRLGNCSA